MKQTLLLIALVLFTLSSASAQTKYKEMTQGHTWRSEVSLSPHR